MTDKHQVRLYANAANNRRFTYDLLGRPLGADLPNTTPAYLIAHEWDALFLRATTAGGRRLSFDYDAAGNRSRLTWPDGFYVTTGYDVLNRPTTVKESGTTLLSDHSDYDDLSRPHTLQRGNATRTSFDYDPRGGLSTLAHDLAGTAQDLTLGFTRNQAQQIKTHTWSNDSYRWLPPAALSRTSSPNGLNQYTQWAGATIGHDTNGNTSSDGQWTWTYDDDHQLRSATLAGAGRTVLLEYDATGRLRSESVNGTVASQFQVPFWVEFQISPKHGVSFASVYDADLHVLRTRQRQCQCQLVGEVRPRRPTHLGLQMQRYVSPQTGSRWPSHPPRRDAGHPPSRHL